MDLSDDQLKRNYSCKICFELFSKNVRAPISLICGHTFCARCVKRLSTIDGTAIVCGICRRGTYADFRKLGKNVTLLELLELCNLLDEDKPNGSTDDEVENSAFTEPWAGTRHFVSSAALAAFSDRHADLRSSVRHFLSPIQWFEFDEPLYSIRCRLFAIEGKLREASESFHLQERQLLQLEAAFQCWRKQSVADLGNDPMFHFANEHDGPSAFNTWGIVGDDEWDQSAWCAWTEDEEKEEEGQAEDVQKGAKSASAEKKFDTQALVPEQQELEATPSSSGLAMSGEKADVVPLVLEKNVSEKELETVTPVLEKSMPFSKTAESTVLSSFSPANGLFAQYTAEMVVSLLDKMSAKDAMQFRKEMNNILGKYEEKLIEG